MSMPEQKPGRSKQDYQTPPEFIAAVKKRFGISEFDCDLAASRDNKQAECWYGNNSLERPWKLGDGWNWLNPPFKDIKPWVEKAWQEANNGAKTLVLIPASVGSNWWAEHVDGRCQVLLLTGRLTFPPETKPYPKDCVLLAYHQEHWLYGYSLWNWRR